MEFNVVVVANGLILMNISRCKKIQQKIQSREKAEISSAFRGHFIGFTCINHRHSFFCEHYTYSSFNISPSHNHI